ncbi:general secretion pathway protein [Rhodobacteraceae bacterium WD3A24]|nr:general secretion pathway protein [Rhodobacteraceae bacterium WD3A24]
MTIKRMFGACLMGLAVLAAMPAAAQNGAVRVMNGSPASSLNVAMNRAVVVESDQPFAELSIANPGIADISTLSNRSIYVLGKAPGRTTLTLLAEDGSLITNIEVRVTPDITEFRERLRQILPGEPIEVRTANDGIVLSGVVSSPARMQAALELAERYAPERVSNLMSVGGTQQVTLLVRFAEMQRSVSQNLSASLGITDGGGLAAGGEGLESGSFAGAASGDRQGRFGISFTSGSLQFQVLLEALESNGMVRTLAEPNLTALSGQEARFLAGGEYPIPIPDGDGGVAIEYKPFGVELNFTPRVLDDNVINLSINAAVSGIDNSVDVSSDVGGVAFRRRETSTTVEMRDGESFAIAGLLQDDFRDLSRQVPWLGDVPILGALFRSAEYQRSQSELVIIITPHLVTPTRGEALALPTDRVRLPSESDLFLHGRVSGDGGRPGGAAGEVARQDFGGPYGYVMD